MPKTTSRNSTSKRALKPEEITSRITHRALQRQFERDPEAQLISNVRDIIGVLGGVDEMARLLSVQPGSVINFLMNDDIPNGWHFRLFWHLTWLGYIVDPYALQWASEGMTLNDDRQLARLKTKIQTWHKRQKASAVRELAREDRRARRLAA